MKYLFFIVIGYIVLYLTVWLHEVGHSIWDCLFGVKQGWYRKYLCGIFIDNPLYFSISKCA